VFKVVENKECFTRGLQLLNRISMQVIKYTQLFTLGFELLNNWWRP